MRCINRSAYNPISTKGCRTGLPRKQLLGLLTALLLLAGTLPAQEAPLTVAIIQPYNLSAYYEAVEGFTGQLRRDLNRDFQTVVYESAGGLYDAMQQRALTADASKIDLVLTVGTQATADVARQVHDIPVVFTMVLNPEHIVQNAPNVVGASLNIPLELQFSMIRETLPGVHTVGMIYDPDRSARLVRESARLAGQLGLRVKAIPVTSQKELPAALEQVGEEADALLGIVDDTVYTSQTARAIIQFTWKERIPFIGASEPYVKAGALWALVFDNRDIGRQSALLAGQILSGTPPAAINGTIPRKIGWIINLRTADLIGVEFPKKIVNQAWEAYE